MARVQYGSIITDMIGSIGGLTFQHNRSGKIVRQKPTGRKLVTFAQNARIHEFQTLVDLWSALSQTNKNLWNTWADTYTFYNNWGEEKALNGYNWFMSINGFLQLVGETLKTAPGSYATPLAVPEYTPLFQYDEVSFEFTSSFDHSDHYLLVWTTSPIRNNNPNIRGALRLTDIVAPGTDTIVDITSEWQSTHGLSLPLTGGTSALACTFCVQTVHDTNGLASVFRSYYAAYQAS